MLHNAEVWVKISHLSLSSVIESRHHLSKLHVVELPVTIEVSLLQKRPHLLRAQLLPERGRAVYQLLGVDVAVIVLVKDHKGLSQVLKVSHLAVK